MADAPSHRDAAKGRLPTLKGTLTHAHLRDAFAELSEVPGVLSCACATPGRASAATPAKSA